MTFGTVFSYLDKEYIYLAETPDVLYAARILDISETKRVDSQYVKQTALNAPNIDRMPVYSYVILETKELKDRAAWFYKTDGSNFTDLFMVLLNITLSKQDLRKIKEEITKDSCVSIRLKELVKILRYNFLIHFNPKTRV